MKKTTLKAAGKIDLSFSGIYLRMEDEYYELIELLREKLEKHSFVGEIEIIVKDKTIVPNIEFVENEGDEE